MDTCICHVAIARKRFAGASPHPVPGVSREQINFSNILTSFSGGQLIQSRIASNDDPITRAAGIPELKQETSVNASAGLSWRAMPGLTFTVDGYLVKVKNRIVLSGLFSRYYATLPASFTSQIPSQVTTVQFFANAVTTLNYGLDIVADNSFRWGRNGLHLLLAGNIPSTNIVKAFCSEGVDQPGDEHASKLPFLCDIIFLSTN